MEQYFKEKKQLLSQYLVSHLKQQEPILSRINMFGPDLLFRLQEFAVDGKMVRGGLVLLAQDMFTEENTDDGLKVAIALELFHSSLLIHDDIMDNDFTRRGNRTIFAQYTDFADKQNLASSKQFGVSMGICAGDIGFFLAFSLLSQLTCDPDKKTKLIRLFSDEMINVGLMQMQDVYFGNSDKTVSEEQILSMYTYKTARYTFTLPLLAGAILSGKSINVLKSLEKLGESLGIIFQIRDDELGIYGSEIKLGKPIGSDIREEKKTLFYSTLFAKVSSKEKEKLSKIFGNKLISPEMIEYVRLLIETTGTRSVINDHVSKLSRAATQLIEDLKISIKYKTVLKELLSYNLTRTS